MFMGKFSVPTLDPHTHSHVTIVRCERRIDERKWKIRRADERGQLIMKS